MDYSIAGVLAWMFLALVAGMMAGKKGLWSYGYFLLAVLLSPFVGIVCAALAEPNERKVESRLIAARRRKRCPFCAELIKCQAIYCPYCTRHIES